MLTLDSQNRITIPITIYKIARTNFNEELRLYVSGIYFYIDNPKKVPDTTICLGTASLDNKHRLIISKHAREFLNLKPHDKLHCILKNDTVYFRKAKT